MNNRFLKGLQSAAAPALLAILLWAWADQQLTTGADLELTVRVRLSADRAVSPATIAVHVRVEGPQEAVNDVHRLAESGEGAFEHQVPSEAGTQESYTVPLLDWLRTHKEFHGRGITVVYCNPRSVPVDLDHLVELPVQVLDKDGRELTDVVAAPARVPVRMFRRDLARVREINARLSQAIIVGAGAPQEYDARLEPPPGVAVMDAKTSVKVTAAAGRGKRRTFENVPVTLSALDVSLWKEFVPEVDPKLLRVKVTVQGAADKIDALKLDDVFAFVVLGKSNAEAEPLDTEIRFRLPEGIEVVVSAAAESRSPDPARIKVQLKKRVNGVGG